MDNGEILTEGPAIAQYLADQKPEKNIAPENGTWQRTRLQEALNFVTSEMHGGAGPMFNSLLSDDAKSVFRNRLKGRLNYLEPILANQPYLLGEEYSIADAYLFTVLGWFKFIDIDLNEWPAVQKFFARVGDRPAVREALVQEALVADIA